MTGIHSMSLPRPRFEAAPVAPAADLPQGCLWPPIEGRLLLEQLSASPAELKPLSGGGWGATIGGRWRAVSSTRTTTFETGREELLAWAAVHAEAVREEVLSPNRCIALQPDGAGAARLWQIVEIEPSLRDELAALEKTDQGATIVGVLRRTAEALSRVPRRLRALGLPLRAGIDHIGWYGSPARPLFIGFLPPPEKVGRLVAPVLADADAVRLELGPALFELAVSRRLELETVRAELAATAPAAELDAALLAAVDRALAETSRPARH